ncbi:MAG: hypothetical protein AB8G18_15275 [Gammaproteobacteria bacterium]
MEFNEMKEAWQQLDKKLSRQNVLQLALLREKHLGAAQSKLRPLFWGMALQMAFGLLSVLIAAPFWIKNLETPVLWLSGFSVHAYGLLVMVMAGYIMLKINRLDMSAPVVGIQKQIIELKKSYIRSGWLVGLPWWVLWIPYSVVVTNMRYGLFAEHMPASFVVSAVVCTVCMIATVLGVKWAQSPRRPELAAKTETLLAGVSLTNAQQSLDELLQFEQEEPNQG